MSSRTEFILLAEDRTQINFMRRFLEAANKHKFRALDMPRGGSGAHHVQVRLPVEIEALRRSHHRAFLIAMTDADALTVRQRRDLLEPHEPQELVAVLIPKRHIETWIRGLTGTQVDEGTDYKKMHPAIGAADIKAAARAALAIVRGGAADSAPPSFRTALPDLKRIVNAEAN